MNSVTYSKPTLLDRVVETIGELPTSPGVVASIMGMTKDLNTDVAKLARVLSADQSLTAKVLRLSNSPFYGRMRGVATLDEAIMILGFFTIRSLVVASSAYSMFSQGGKNTIESRLWNHSLAAAMGARLVARCCGSAHIEEVFLAGLLHDIGSLVLLKKMKKEYDAVVAQVADGQADIVTAELNKLGFTHEELGALILDRWNFPPILKKSVEFHHHPDQLGPDENGVLDNEAVKAAHIVCFADELAKSIGHSMVETAPVDMAALPSAQYLGLTAEDITTISSELVERFAEEQKLFEG